MDVKVITARALIDNLIQRFEVEGIEELENKISHFVKLLSG